MDMSEILQMLVSVPSPSGFEASLKQVIKSLAGSCVDEYVEDIHGNLICYKYGDNPLCCKTLMLVAHMDEVGLMVSYIEESGFIRFVRIGGVDLRLLKGRNVKIIHEGDTVQGVIGSLPVHLRRNGDNKDTDESDLWIDIGVSGREEVEKIVSIGDCIVLDSSFIRMPDNLIASRSCDDKCGLAALIKLLQSLSEEKNNVNIAVVASVQEEIGLRGAKTASYSVSPDLCIAVDVAHATDYPTISKAKYGDIRLGRGPVVPVGSDFTPSVQEKLRQIAVRNDINVWLYPVFQELMLMLCK